MVGIHWDHVRGRQDDYFVAVIPSVHGTPIEGRIERRDQPDLWRASVAVAKGDEPEIECWPEADVPGAGHEACRLWAEAAMRSRTAL